MIIAVGAAIIVKTRVLVVRRNSDDSFLPGYWDLPGGTKRPDERSYAALWRELKEELGSEAVRGLHTAAPFHVFDYVMEPSSEMLTHITFAIHHTSEFVPTLTAHSEYLWADASQLLQLRPITYEMASVYAAVTARYLWKRTS